MDEPIDTHQVFFGVLFDCYGFGIVLIEIVDRAFDIVDGIVLYLTAFFNIPVDGQKNMVQIR